MKRLDLNKVKDGIVREYYEPNKDGTVPWVKIAHRGDANRKFQQRLDALTRPHRRKMQMQVFGEAAAQAIIRQAFIETCLIEWGHIQPNDDGKELAFGRDTAEQLLGDDQYYPFYMWMLEEATNFENYEAERREVEVKN